MIVHSVLHSLQPHDGMSEFCLLFRVRCGQLGVENRLYAYNCHPSLENLCRPSSEIAFLRNPDDILIWHCADSPELYLAERFPGRRVLFHHNVTPPHLYPAGSRERESCEQALARLAAVPQAFPLALGASDFTRRDLAAMGFERTGVFPLFSKVSEQQGATASTPDGAITLVTLCRVVPSKNLEESIEIIAALKQRISARLLVIGSTSQTPQYVEQLHALARKKGLIAGEHIEFTGQLDEGSMRQRMREAHAYLCTSLHEGFCLPLIEAMGLGLPVFATPRTAIAETLDGAGVLLPLDSPAAAAQLVFDTLMDPRKRDETLESQRRRLQFFTPENDRKRITALLQEAEAIPLVPSASSPSGVSVVVCTWNRVHHLENCLEALQHQVHQPIEVIAVNGPSTDHTEAVLAGYGDRIKIIRNPERNLSISRNLGIAAASGDFIAFLDDDAIAHPKWLAEVLHVFRDPQTGAVGGATYRFTNEETEFCNGLLLQTGHPFAVQEFPGTHFDGRGGFWNTVRGNNCVFRADALRAVGGFDERFEYAHEEADIGLRLGRAGWRVRHAPLAVVHHSNQPSHNRRSEFDVNWRTNLKNTVYCAMRNRPDASSALGFLAKVLAANARIRLRDASEWWLQRRISFPLFLKIAAGCLVGLVEGTAKSLFRKPVYLSQRAAPTPEFRPFEQKDPYVASVAHLTQEVPFRAPTGVGYSSIWLGRGLTELGYRNHLIARGEEPSRDARDLCWFHFSPDRLEGAAAHLSEFPDAQRAFGRSLAAWHSLQELAVRDGVRTVISPLWESEGLVAALDPRFIVVPVVITPIHEVCQIEGRPLTGSAAWLSDFEHQLLEHAAAVVGISQSSLQDVLAYHQVTPKVQRVIPHGLPDPGYRAPRTPPAPRVLFVGPASARKGTPELLAAIPQILEQCPDAHFDIAGNLPSNPHSVEAKWIEAFRREHPAAVARTHFLGRVSEEQKDALYRQARVLVMPSRYESFGIPAAEAQAYGLPVVATSVGGLPEVVDGNSTALLIPREDPAALAEATVRLLRDDALWLRMSQAARSRYEARFSIHQMASSYAELIRDLERRYNEHQPLLAAKEAQDCPHSAGSVLWHDALYNRNYRVLPKGRPGEWLRLADIPVPAEGRFRIDIYCGVGTELLKDPSLCRLLLLDTRGTVHWTVRLGEPDFPPAPWGILSATGMWKHTVPESLCLEIQGAGDAELRIQRIEVRQIP